MENQKNKWATESVQPEYPEITTYLKYCSDDQRVIDGIFKEKKIGFAQPWGLNDPLEFDPSVRANLDRNIHLCYDLGGTILPSEELFFRTLIVESQINDYGILSLTRALHSFDLWGRYANGHKGFLIELKGHFNKHPCIKSANGQEYPWRK